MVRVYSRLLKETIICVEDGMLPADAPPEERVLYTRSEVIALQGVDSETLRAIHEVKKHFGGRYLGPSPKR
ncbi:MAG TPA: hypothetical protein VGM37_20310 [Armatimonadota bacterium]